MKQINATRDQIIEMLKSGEIVFAAYCEGDFLFGRGIILHDNKPTYALRHRERGSDLCAYGGEATYWFVDYAKPVEFQVGDICEFGGVEGVVTEVLKAPEHEYPVTWKTFCDEHEAGFTLDGNFCSWHTKPLLNFIRRPKKKVKKTIEIVTWVEVSEHGKVLGVSTSDAVKTQPGSKLVKSIATTEIEVEE